MPSDQADNLFNCSGIVFFNKLEKAIESTVPEVLRNILLVNDIDCASVLSKLNNEFLGNIEKFMKNDFNADMIPEDHCIDDYLGKYRKHQQNFEFSTGQRIIINLMVEGCKKKAQTVTNPNGVENSAEALEREHHHLEDQNFQQPVVNVDKNVNLAKYIGKLMITAYNDAKRSTLSSWSWPSRYLAADMANNYNANGNVHGWVHNFQYLTPSQHPQFLDCIVKSDLARFVSSLKNSLALSLRVDGSVDRMQHHNIYVLANVIYKDTSMSTVFLGFKVPKDGKALAYFESVKEVIGDILPWEEFLLLMSSIVTDGENLNSGDENGLWVRIQRSDTANKPILSIWCVDHRFNLSWKDLSNDVSLVKNLIEDASSLSTYFHKSGDRTQKLGDAAIANNLPQPLRYLAYFAVRWTEFVYALFNVTLRNWRCSMHYFLKPNEIGLSNRWLLYDRIHLLTFITDVLCLMKTFQKTFQSDSISILNVRKKKEELIIKLQKCVDETVPNGVGADVFI